MAERLRLPPPQDLPQPRMDPVRPEDVSYKYHKRTDMLIIRFGEPRAAISMDYNGIWMRMDPTSGQITGFEIEDFTEVFLAHQPELALAWREAHSPKTTEAQKGSWLKLLLNFVRQMVGDGPNHPQQPPLLRARTA